MATIPVSGRATLGSLSLVQRLLVLRLSVGFGMILGAAISLIGTSWDIQWHEIIGRDRTLIPPHIMMLSGITLVGLLALITVVVETIWVRRHPPLARFCTSFAGLFWGSLGAYVAGFAALNAAIAFPLDSYWHALFGIDVAIWAPFHVMILVGMALTPLGAAGVLRSTSQMAEMLGMRWAIHLSHLLGAIALGTMMGIFTLLLSDALDRPNSLQLGILHIDSFSLLSCLLAGYTFSLARFTLPSRLSATYVVLCYIGFAVIFSVFVPSATSALVASEGLQYRGAGQEMAPYSLVALDAWPLMPVIAAPLMDLCFNWARRRHWSATRLVIVASLMTLPCFFPSMLPVFFHLSRLIVFEPAGALSMSVALLLGLVGAYLGIRMGRLTGEIFNPA